MMAEVLGGGIALQMLCGLPILAGSALVTIVSAVLLLTGSYARVERVIIGFVSLIGLAFLAEIMLVRVDWPATAVGWVTPSLPAGSPAIIVSVLGAVVMPHNLFLHSEVIQSQHFEGAGDEVIRERLDHEFVDTLLSMGIRLGHQQRHGDPGRLDLLRGGHARRRPRAGGCHARAHAGPRLARTIFALALLLAGASSSVTAGMAAGTVSAGMAGEPYDIRDRHSSVGVVACFAVALAAIALVPDPFSGLGGARRC